MYKRVLYPLLITFCLVYSCSNEVKTYNEKFINSDTLEQYLTNASDKNLSKGKRKEYINKAYSTFKTLDNTIYKKEKASRISAIYYELKEYELSKKMDQEMLTVSILLNDSLGIAKAYSYLGIGFRQKQYIDSAYNYFYRANKIYTLLDHRKNIAHNSYAFDHGRTLMDLAKLSRKIKDYSESESRTIEAIKKFKVSGNLKYIPLSYNNLGLITNESGRYEEAVNYFEKAIECAKKTLKDTLYKTISYNNIGTAYKSQKKYDKAIEYYQKALSYNNFLKSKPKRYARLLDNLGYTKFLNNKTSDSALYLFNKAHHIRDSIQDIVGLSTNYLHYAEYYQANGNSSLARSYALKAKDAAPIINENTELLQSYQLLAQVSPPEEGRTYAIKYIKLNDSLTKRDNLFKDKFARIRFESENLEKENEEKSQQILEVQTQNTIYFLGLVLLVTFIGFLIYFSRQRNRSLAQQNKIVAFQTAYETETRISKRLHDELGNDIFQVMLQYQNDPHDPQIPKKLNTAYTKARDISRENSEFEVDETYVDELTDMLTNYAKNNIRLVLRGVEKIEWNTIDKNLKITIYRVLQELMTNMQKHSHSDLVAIVCKQEKNKLRIKYSDNGVGIAAADITSKNGLRNTEKRIQAINGTIVFNSEKNKGFKAEITIPA